MTGPQTNEKIDAAAIHTELCLCLFRLEEAGLNKVSAADTGMLFFSMCLGAHLGEAMSDRLRDLADVFERRNRN